jgi:hypothetical protein
MEYYVKDCSEDDLPGACHNCIFSPGSKVGIEIEGIWKVKNWGEYM